MTEDAADGCDVCTCVILANPPCGALFSGVRDVES